MTEERYAILAVTLETRKYIDTARRTKMGRALVAHYINENNEPDYKLYGYRDTWYARNTGLSNVKIVLKAHSNPYLFKSADGDSDTIVLGYEYWKYLQVSNVDLT
jgi:hypothetical protein